MSAVLSTIRASKPPEICRRQRPTAEPEGWATLYLVAPSIRIIEAARVACCVIVGRSLADPGQPAVVLAAVTRLPQEGAYDEKH